MCIRDSSYSYGSSATVPNYVADSTTVSGYKFVSELKETTITDREIKYTYNGATSTEYKGPKAGVKYYYYVIAYKNGKSYEYKDSADETYTSGASKSASAIVSTAKIAKPTSPKAKATKAVSYTHLYTKTRERNNTKSEKIFGNFSDKINLWYTYREIEKNYRSDIISDIEKTLPDSV